MDLENFPTRELAKDMMSMISPIYDDSYVGKWIFEVMSVSLGLAKETIEGLADEAFPETATWTLPYWEQAYGITTNENLSIEERRAAISKKRTYHAPMNPYRIQTLVSDLCGRTVTLVENTLPHTFDIVISPGTSEVILDSVIALLDEIKQSQKSYRIIFGNTVGVNVRASPTRLAFGYQLASEYMKAGQYPEPANVGVSTDFGIEVAASETAQTFPYVLAGTQPDVNNVGSSVDGNVTASAASVAASVIYKMCGLETL